MWTKHRFCHLSRRIGGDILRQPYERFQYQIENFKSHLKYWNKHLYGDINRKIEALQLLIDNLNKDLQNSWDENDYEELREKNKN